MLEHAGIELATVARGRLGHVGPGRRCPDRSAERAGEAFRL